ncbi:hypothetical protein VYU27_008589 [Nannochloropsis oceanica]
MLPSLRLVRRAQQQQQHFHLACLMDFTRQYAKIPVARVMAAATENSLRGGRGGRTLSRGCVSSSSSGSSSMTQLPSPPPVSAMGVEGRIALEGGPEDGREDGRGGLPIVPYMGEKHMGRDYYSKRFRLLVQHMVEGGPPAAMLEENEERWVGLPSFQWKMAVVNFMNEVFLRPKETLGDEYMRILHAFDDVPGSVLGAFHNAMDAWHAKVRRHSFTMSGDKPPLPPLPLEFARVEQMLTPFILRRTSSASPPSLASSTAPSLASTDHAEGEAGQGGREERLRHVAAMEEEERKEKKAMDLGQLVRVCDMRLPHDWYPYARLMRRKIVYHGGPTNSGKTYHALQRLKAADPTKGGGLYLGPLRLLALEVYDALNEDGVYCSLLTGQEKRLVPFSDHTSATVEMCNLHQDYDVAVVDEIQMIGDPERGHAWTRALLGLRAKEIHLCGGPEARDVVTRLCQATGDELEFRNYERMTELKVAEDPLLDYSQVQAGDCIVAFNKSDICSIKQEIEAKTRHKCCMVYGSLPSETRSAQARIFNEEGTGYDVLVASDAIGMGLNLNIKRIIFHSLIKGSDDGGAEVLHSGMIKQIAGRAGRRSSRFPNGEVTCYKKEDMQFLRSGLGTATEQIARAGLFPTAEQLEDFSILLQTQVERVRSSGGMLEDETGRRRGRKGRGQLGALDTTLFSKEGGMEGGKTEGEEEGTEEGKEEEEEEGLGLMEVMDSFFNMAELRGDPGQERQAVAGFVREWQPFDWTRELDGGEYWG